MKIQTHDRLVAVRAFNLEKPNPKIIGETLIFRVHKGETLLVMNVLPGNPQHNLKGNILLRVEGDQKCKKIGWIRREQNLERVLRVLKTGTA